MLTLPRSANIALQLPLRARPSQIASLREHRHLYTEVFAERWDAKEVCGGGEGVGLKALGGERVSASVCLA